MIGYERVGATLMQDELPTQHRNEELETEERIRDLLIGSGLQDTVNYALSSPQNHDRLNPGQQTNDVDYIAVANPSVYERRVMRQSMLVSALENAQYNLRYTNRLAIFEIGRVYLPAQSDGELPIEDRRLSILLTGPRQPLNFYSSRREQPATRLLRLEGNCRDVAGTTGIWLRRRGIPIASGDSDLSGRAVQRCVSTMRAWVSSVSFTRVCVPASTCQPTVSVPPNSEWL